MKNKVQEELSSIFRTALKPVLKDEDLEVEFFQDGEILKVKIRGKKNEWLEGLSLPDLDSLLFRLRTLLDTGGWKTTKLQASIHRPPYQEKTNIRMMYNPHWRRYENYEIFFRNKTQSRRTYL